MSGSKVLIIEDNKGDARLIVESLKEFNIDLIHEKTLTEGLERIKEDNIDLILLDLGLPESNGLETFKKVHSKHEIIPIIVMTGLNDRAIALDAVKIGAQDFFVKGEINGNTLSKSIQFSIERNKKSFNQNQVPSFLRKPAVNTLLTAMKDGAVKEFEQVIDDVRDLYYPTMETIISSPETCNKILNEFEKHNIVKKEFRKSIMVCPNCNSTNLTIKSNCSSCGSNNIFKIKNSNSNQSECINCGNKFDPVLIFECKTCRNKSEAPNLKIRRIYSYIVNKDELPLIEKWIKDLQDILFSAREFWRLSQTVTHDNSEKSPYKNLSKLQY